jgi:beta-glucuronidase
VFLYCGGANHKARIWLNGKLVAAHRGGFTPFNVEVGDVLTAGENLIVAKVDSLCREDEIPTERNDWLNYGGLTRELLLIELPRLFVRNCHVQLAKGSLSRIEGWVDVEGAAAGTRVVVEVPDAGLRYESETDASGRAPLEFDAELELWTPERPTLHRVTVSAGDDRFEDEIGFRSIETRGTEILLNGEAIFLRGIAMHEESVRHPGRAYGPDDAASALSLIKELNCNFVRLAHYPHNESMVRAAERSGLLIWSEIPVYHDVAFENPETLASAKQQLNEMIERDRNRAGIAFWSIGNETMPSEARNRFMQELANEVRSADPTRLVTAALLSIEGMQGAAAHVGARLRGSSPEPVKTVISDPLGEFVDVIGYNQYLGWYAPTFLARSLGAPEEQVREAILEAVDGFQLDTAFEKPVIVSETGGAAKQGVHGGRLDAWTEELQAAIYETEVGALIDRKGSPVRGLSPWILKDFRSPMRLNSRMQSYWNRKGIVSPEGERKQAFFVLQRRYAEHAERTGR